MRHALKLLQKLQKKPHLKAHERLRKRDSEVFKIKKNKRDICWVSLFTVVFLPSVVLLR
jgi:hypothetical protein